MKLNDNSFAEQPELKDRICGMESMLAEIHKMLANRQVEKDWYTVREVAEILKKSEFTVREWCRLGRVFAEKRACGRGHSKEWIVASTELLRIQNEGLLPLKPFHSR